MNLSELHIAIQISMGWMNCHLYEFEYKGTRYGSEDDEFAMDIEDDFKFKLSDLLQNEKDSLNYMYDFSDDWDHKITLEKILPFDKSAPLSQCIKGKRSCPPEDCGGMWGYGDLIEAIKDPKHENHESMLEWTGGEFDPEYFELKEVNELLSEYINN